MSLWQREQAAAVHRSTMAMLSGDVSIMSMSIHACLKQVKPVWVAGLGRNLLKVSLTH